jgi:hypothetical protein
MELYISPPEGASQAALTRQQVLHGLLAVGVTVSRQEEEGGAGRLRSWWTVYFQDNHSMLDKTMIPDRVCAAFEALGWEVDQESIG